jgi:hypothetical protein
MTRAVPLIIITVAVVIAVAYAVFWVWSQGFDLVDQFWSGTMGNFLATLLGVVVGIPAGLWANRLVERGRQQEEQRRVVRLLREELDAALNHELLNDPLNPLTSPVYLDTGAWDSISVTGDANSIQDTRLLGEISNAYHRVESLNEWLRRFYDVTYGTGSAVTFRDPETGQKFLLATEVSKVLMNLASQHRPYIEMVALKLRKLDAG